MGNKTITKKERLELAEPLRRLKSEKAWVRLEELGKKISQAWKERKSALELIQEQRR